MKIAILPGDGIGPEITAQAVKVLNALGESFEMETAQVGGAGQAAAEDEIGNGDVQRVRNAAPDRICDARLVVAALQVPERDVDA